MVTAQLSLCLCLTVLASGHSVVNHDWFQSCSTDKAAKIAAMEEELASVKAAMKEAHLRLAQLSRQQTGRDRITDLVNKTQSGVGAVSVQAKRYVTAAKRQAGEPCQPIIDRVRLVDGPTGAGRLEVLVNDQWSTVTTSGLGPREASVVCGALGLNGIDAAIVPTAVFGEGGDTLLYSASCRASVGVICDGLDSAQVRLVGGAGPYEGRVEVNLAGQWSTVCDAAWDTKDAQVICRMLGYNEGHASAVGNAEFGAGTGSSWFTNIACNGDEAHVLECSSRYTLGRNACPHTSDAGVICDNWFHYPIRLVGGHGPWEGRVEVRAFGHWGSIASDGWGTTDAMVVCRALGYSGAAVAMAGDYGAGTGPVWLNDVECDGTEQHLLQCYTRYPMGTRTEFYNHTSDAGVLCVGNNDNSVDSLQVRLVNGSSSSEGRVEIRVGGEWGTVCDDSWDAMDAHVVCGQLGHSGGIAVVGGAFGAGSGPIHMDEVACQGDEDHLARCPFPGFDIVTDCTHAEDAGVRCT